MTTARDNRPAPLDDCDLLPIAEMRALDFVRWDRFAGDATQLVVYGWIDRTDGRCDFVLLDCVPEGVGFVTSSSEWTAEINRRLYGDGGEGHNSCVRVEEHPASAPLPNVIRLGSEVPQK